MIEFSRESESVAYNKRTRKVMMRHDYSVTVDLSDRINELMFDIETRSVAIRLGVGSCEGDCPAEQAPSILFKMWRGNNPSSYEPWPHSGMFRQWSESALILPFETSVKVSHSGRRIDFGLPFGRKADGS